MTIDIQSLNEKTLQVLHNSDEFVRKWIEFISAPAGTVNLEYYDENGNLQTVAFSNRNKLVQDFIVNMNSVMSKTFYVDQINGNDGNDGSASNPLKTPEEALARIPNGGWGRIWLLSDLVCDNTRQTVSKDNITVLFLTDTNKLGRNGKISFINNRNLLVNGNNNRLWFRDVDFDFQFSGLTSPMFLFTWNTHAFAGDASFNMEGSIGFYNSNISISTDTDYGITFVDSIPFIRLENVDITYTNATGNDAFHFANAKSAKVVGVYNSTLTINGTATSFKENILNVVKDTNGVPRNIISNLIL